MSETLLTLSIGEHHFNDERYEQIETIDNDDSVMILTLKKGTICSVLHLCCMDIMMLTNLELRDEYKSLCPQEVNAVDERFSDWLDDSKLIDTANVYIIGSIADDLCAKKFGGTSIRTADDTIKIVYKQHDDHVTVISESGSTNVHKL